MMKMINKFLGRNAKTPEGAEAYNRDELNKGLAEIATTDAAFFVEDGVMRKGAKELFSELVMKTVAPTEADVRFEFERPVGTSYIVVLENGGELVMTMATLGEAKQTRSAVSEGRSKYRFDIDSTRKSKVPFLRDFLGPCDEQYVGWDDQCKVLALQALLPHLQNDALDYFVLLHHKEQGIETDADKAVEERLRLLLDTIGVLRLPRSRHHSRNGTPAQSQGSSQHGSRAATPTREAEGPEITRHHPLAVTSTVTRGRNERRAASTGARQPTLFWEDSPKTVVATGASASGKPVRAAGRNGARRALSHAAAKSAAFERARSRETSTAATEFNMNESSGSEPELRGIHGQDDHDAPTATEAALTPDDTQVIPLANDGTENRDEATRQVEDMFMRNNDEKQRQARFDVEMKQYRHDMQQALAEKTRDVLEAEGRYDELQRVGSEKVNQLTQAVDDLTEEGTQLTIALQVARDQLRDEASDAAEYDAMEQALDRACRQLDESEQDVRRLERAKTGDQGQLMRELVEAKAALSTSQKRFNTSDQLADRLRKERDQGREELRAAKKTSARREEEQLQLHEGLRMSERHDEVADYRLRLKGANDKVAKQTRQLEEAEVMINTWRSRHDEATTMITKLRSEPSKELRAVAEYAEECRARTCQVEGELARRERTSAETSPDTDTGRLVALLAALLEGKTDGKRQKEAEYTPGKFDAQWFGSWSNYFDNLSNDEAPDKLVTLYNRLQQAYPRNPTMETEPTKLAWSALVTFLDSLRGQLKLHDGVLFANIEKEQPMLYATGHRLWLEYTLHHKCDADPKNFGTQRALSLQTLQDDENIQRNPVEKMQHDFSMKELRKQATKAPVATAVKPNKEAVKDEMADAKQSAPALLPYSTPAAARPSTVAQTSGQQTAGASRGASRGNRGQSDFAGRMQCTTCGSNEHSGVACPKNNRGYRQY